MKKMECLSETITQTDVDLFKATMDTIDILVSMGEDMYQECKYTLLAKAKGQPKLTNYLDAMFLCTEQRRLLMLEMKGGA